MKSSDLGLTLFIFLIFVILFVFNILAIGLQNIQNNWPEYRCNPMIMPFAGSLGPAGTDATDNFSYCIQNMQTNYMQYLLQPINYNLNVMGNIAGTFTTALNDVRAFISNMRDMITDIIQNVMGVFLNIIIEFQKIIIDTKDLFSKLVGILATMVYMLDGSVKTMESAWAGPNGQLVQALCFDPDTLIKTKQGTYVKMCDLKLGEKLKHGNEVRAILKLQNLDENGSHQQSFYKINGGENNKPIYVTGSHLIYDHEINNFIQVEDYKLATPTNKSSDYFTCLITSDHLICIGDKIFHDWEDSTITKDV